MKNLLGLCYFEPLIRQKELLNIEIQIKEIELKRLHQLYEDEIRERLSQSEG